MYYIVGDIGNTSTRICLINKKSKIKKSFIFETKKIFKKGFIQKLFKKFSKDDTKKNILFSSVVPLAFKKIKNDLKKTSYKILEIKRLRLNRLYTETFQYRKNQIKILENFGFKKEGILRKHNIKNNKPVNVIVHAIIK